MSLSHSLAVGLTFCRQQFDNSGAASIAAAYAG